MSPEKHFTQQQKEAMVAAIQEAEKNTSGEIRIHIEKYCKKDVFERAVEIFSQLEMHLTALKNGVLIYVALSDHKLAIIGDEGIHHHVPGGYWDNTTAKLIERIKQGEMTEGLCDTVLDVGQQLKKWFPYQNDDINELPDDISFGRE